MKKLGFTVDHLKSKAERDRNFRNRLLDRPRETIEQEFEVQLDHDHEIHVHEETYDSTHLVLPPCNKFTEAEREEARTGARSLKFLRKTLHDPAPPIRPPISNKMASGIDTVTTEALAEAARDSIRRGLMFLESAMDANGAWHCIRFNLADPGIPRHYERPPFISALGVLALECCAEARAKAICAATRAYIVETIEHPGLWRYYRHLPQDLDSTALCSLAIGTHPWILLGRNVSRMLENRDGEGLFTTWVLAEDEPNVVSSFRIEADPVVNANVIAYLGDHPGTREAQQWLVDSIGECQLEGSSKWYPDMVTVYHAVSRAMIRNIPAFDQLRPTIADRILSMCSQEGDYGNVLQTAQAVSALHNIGSLEAIDAKRQAEKFIGLQREDGSWPELLAFGDQSLKWGLVGQIGHGSEAVTSAFCIEALEHLIEALGS